MCTIKVSYVAFDLFYNFYIFNELNMIAVAGLCSSVVANLDFANSVEC